jgi:RHS repeat-associated protein
MKILNMNYKVVFCLLFSMITINVSAAVLQCKEYTIQVSDPWGGSYYTYGSVCWLTGETGGGGSRSTEPNEGGGGGTPTPTTPSEDYCGGNPVLISSGKKYQHTIDHAANFGMLNLERFYSQTGTSSGLLGNKWKLNVEYSIEVTKNSNGDYDLATLINPDGRNVNLFFSSTTENWHYMNGQQALFSENQSNNSWIFQDNNGTTKNYNSDGRIISKFNSQQQGVLYVYDGEQLEKVVSTTGDALYLSYNEVGLVDNIEIDNVTYSFSYSEDELLETVTLPNSSTYDFEYSDERHFGALTAKNIDGKPYASWAYNEDGRALYSEHSDGAERTEFSYNGDATTVTNALGKETTYNFTTINGKRVPTTIEGHDSGSCIAANQSYTYDDFGNKDKVTDWQGNTTDYDIDHRGLLLKKTNASGTENAQVAEYEWHSFLPLPLKKTTSNIITESKYDINNRIIERKITARSTSVQRIWSYQYDLHDNGVIKKVQTFTPLGLGNIKTFDSKGNLLTSTNALGHSITYADYDSLGNPGSQTDINGIKTKFEYDEIGRLIESKELSNGKKITKFKYNAMGQVVEVESSATGKTTYQYDDAYRKVGLTNAFGDSVNFTLNAAGNITNKIISEDINPWTFSECAISSERPECSQGKAQLMETLYPSTIGKTFDALSRVTAVSRGGENISSYQYDANNNIVKAIDGNGSATTHVYDSLNRKVSETDANGKTTRYQYNNQNLITVLTDVRGNQTTYTYNDFGELIQKLSPDSGVSSFIYDEAGQKTSATRADGTELTFGYDVLNRLITTSNEGNILLQYIYDNCKNGQGRLCSVIDSSGTTAYKYHKTGQLKKKKVVISDDKYQLSYKYDAAGRVKSIHYPSGLKVKYKVDKLGNFIAIKAKGKDLLNNVTYKPFGPIKGWVFGNGQQRAIQYDHQLKIQRILSTNVQDLSYQYDLSGNITSLENLMHDRINNFAYDELNRLTVIAGSDIESYEYDSLGNRLTKDDFFNSSKYQIANDSNQLLSVDKGNETRVFNYDDNGNIIADEAASLSKQFTYNAENRMSVATVNGKTTTYTYNAHGKRVSKILVDGTQYHYIYGAAGKLLAESKNGKIIKEYIYLNGQLVGLVQDKSLYYVHTDHLGRPEIVTDKHQNTVWQAENKAFDREVIIDSIDGLNIGFPGQYWDEEKYSWYNGFRDYDSTIGRYLQSDPIGVNGGVNTYNYVLGNPLILTDMLGLLPAGGYPPEGPDDGEGGGGDPAKCSAIVDTTALAVIHYYHGNGSAVELGDATKEAVQNHATQVAKRQKIILGTTTSMSGNYSVDLISIVYHVGQTRVDYLTTCQGDSCSTTYTAFSGDGFWDIFSGGDLAGSEGELGGTPYAYNPYSWIETYDNPYN